MPSGVRTCSCIARSYAVPRSRSGNSTCPPMKPAAPASGFEYWNISPNLLVGCIEPSAATARSGVRSLNSNSHSKSWRGRPVQAQIRCLTSTWRVVAVVAEPERRQQVRHRRVPRDLVLIDEPREQQRRQRLRVRGNHVEAVGVDWCGRAEFADAEAARKHGLAVLHEADRDAGHARRLACRLDERAEGGDPGRVERMCGLAGKRLARVALRQQSIEDEADLRATLLADVLGHVVDDHRPLPVGVLGERGDVAAFVRRRLVGHLAPSGPAVLVG